MRLMLNDLRRRKHIRTIEKASDYIGTTTENVQLDDVLCAVAPLSDRLDIERYGNSDKQTVQLIFDDKRADIQRGDIIVHDGQEYKIISLMSYSSHIAAVGECEVL